MSPARVGPALGLVKSALPMLGTLGRPEAPKYIRVRDWLMEHILSSGFARGEKLPSESDLVRRFDVSRVTVRQALDALRTEGFIESRHGKGWFLRRICAVQNLGKLQGFGEMLAPMGVKVPIAVSAFPDDLYQAPRSWVERAYPTLIYYNKAEKGGHFAAWEQPDIFIREVRAGFKSLRGTQG